MLLRGIPGSLLQRDDTFALDLGDELFVSTLPSTGQQPSLVSFFLSALFVPNKQKHKLYYMLYNVIALGDIPTRKQ